jgi:meso-butanediol dehydrogenase / (S,S)-butanediol dehydrogenase / diacetyl reductase
VQGRLDGRVAIVTGASQGIGAAIAERFAAEGAHVAMCARREGPLAELAGAIEARSGSASFAALDVADHERLAAFIQSTAAARGRLDVLVNNAPSVNYGAITDMSVEAFQRDFAVNVDATFVATREALRLMLPARRGSIVNIASIMGLLASPGLSGYGTAKAALIQFTKYAAIEGARSGVRVNAIAPGVINTLLTAAGFAGASAEYGRKIAAQVPLGRFGEPTEIADTALFLASDESSYVTGVCLPVDGGRAAELFIPPP